MKRWMIALLSTALAVIGALTAWTALPVSAAETADTLRFRLDLTKLDLETAGSANRIFSALAPFNAKGYGYTSVPIPNGSRIEYDFYSSAPLSGLGGFEIQFRYTTSKGSTEYAYFSNAAKTTGLTDPDGHSVDALCDLTEVLGNGWYRRSFEISYDALKLDIASMTLEHFFVYAAPKTDEIRQLKADGARWLDLYYRNVKIARPNGADAIIYDGSHLAPIQPDFWRDFAYDIFALGFAGSGDFYKFTPMTNYDQTTGEYAIELDCVVGPELLSVRPALPDPHVFVTNTDYDLSKLVSASVADASLSVASVHSADGVELPLLNGVVRFTARGAYTAEIIAQTNAGKKARLVWHVSVYDEEEPVLFDRDFAAFPKFGTAGTRVDLPLILAWLHGQQAFSVNIEITDPAGNKVVPEKDGHSFMPKLLTEGDYQIRYYAENDAFVAEKTLTIFIRDPDKPIVSFKAFAGEVELGSVYRIPKVEITDMTDGVINDYELSLVNPYGEKVELGEFDAKQGFLAKISGYYTFFVNVTDKHGNQVESRYELKVKPSRDAVYTLRVYVPQEKRAAGIRKLYAMSIYKTDLYNITFGAGDALCYGVYSSTPMAGIGSFTGQFTGNYQGQSWPFWHDFYNGISDTNGFGMNPKSDISSRLTNESGESVWYQRRVPLGGKLIGGDTSLFAAIIDTTEACGEYIEVTYRDVHIEKAGGKKVEILPSIREIEPKHWLNENIGDAYLSATLDRYPVLLTQFLPNKAELGTQVTISNRVMFDYHQNELLDVDVRIFDSDGTKIALMPVLNGYAFRPEKAGIYRIEFSAANHSGSVLLAHSLTVADTLPPEIQIGEYSETVEVGQRFRIPDVTISDYVTAQDGLISKVSCYFNSKEVIPEDGWLFAEKKGLFTIVIETEDEAGNDNFLTLTIESKETVSDTGGGCSGGIEGASMLFAGISILAGAGLTLFARKKYKR